MVLSVSSSAKGDERMAHVRQGFDALARGGLDIERCLMTAQIEP